MTDFETHTVWVCVDCMMHEANGECGRCDSPEGHEREPLNRLDLEPDGSHYSLGLTAEEHDSDCTALEDGGECDCATREFSWSMCEGCGSMLGGSREAMTLWTPKKDD